MTTPAQWVCSRTAVGIARSSSRHQYRQTSPSAAESSGLTQTAARYPGRQSPRAPVSSEQQARHRSFRRPPPPHRGREARLNEHLWGRCLDWRPFDRAAVDALWPAGL